MIPRTNHARSDEGRWLYPLSLMAIGAVVVSLAARKLGFEDPRWTHNAWTYVIGVPLGIGLISLVSQGIASRWLQRTLHAAFLLSLALHVLLLSEAYNLIVLTRLSPKDSKDQSATNTQQQANQNYSTVSYQPRFDNSNPSLPAATITRSEMIDSEATNTTLSNSTPTDLNLAEKLNALKQDLRLKEHELSQLELEKLQAELQQAEIQSQAQEIDRQQSQVPNDTSYRLRDSIDVPQQDNSLDQLPSEELEQVNDVAQQPKQTQTTNDRSRESMTLGPSGFQPNLKPRDTNLRSNRALPSNESRERDIVGSLDAQLRQSTQAFPVMPRSNDVGTTLSPSDIVFGQSVASAPSFDGNATDAIPSAELTGPARDRSKSDDSNDGGRSSSGSLASGGNARSTTGGTASSLGPRNTDISPRSTSMSGSGLKMKSGSEDTRMPIEVGQNRSIQIQRSSPTISLPQATAVPTSAFAKRGDRNKDGNDSSELGPWGPQTEAAIEAGLEFLAEYQHEDGSWSFDDFGDRPLFTSHAAATALALLSFQGAGYSHLEYRYKDNCKRAIDYLVANQAADGDLYIASNEYSDRNARFYTHGIAALALCEAFGMTQDESLRGPAQRSIDFLAKTQDPVGGGWRYNPGIDSDTSVTGWCMMAMKSAELAGLNVKRESYAGIERHLERAQASNQQPYLYRYNPTAADTAQTRHGLQPTPTMTGVGLLLRLYTGWTRDNRNMVQGADYLLESLPQMGTADDPQRDTYYWYYATQVIFHMGGNYWKQWNQKLHPMLIQSQLQRGNYAGSWDAGGAIPDRWGAFAGRLYVTTMNLLSLEVYYRHLPIYEETGR
jgi:hypothetical protein